MTYDDDFLRFEDGPHAGVVLALRDIGAEWPPPERIVTSKGIEYERVSFSMITDEERSTMTNVRRGSAYAQAPDD